MKMERSQSVEYPLFAPDGSPLVYHVFGGGQLARDSVYEAQALARRGFTLLSYYDRCEEMGEYDCTMTGLDQIDLAAGDGRYIFATVCAPLDAFAWTRQIKEVGVAFSAHTLSQMYLRLFDLQLLYNRVAEGFDVPRPWDEEGAFYGYESALELLADAFTFPIDADSLARLVSQGLRSADALAMTQHAISTYAAQIARVASNVAETMTFNDYDDDDDNDDLFEHHRSLVTAFIHDTVQDGVRMLRKAERRDHFCRYAEVLTPGPLPLSEAVFFFGPDGILYNE